MYGKTFAAIAERLEADTVHFLTENYLRGVCLLYTSDAADERSSVDLGGRRIIKKKKRVVVDGVMSIMHIIARIEET